MKHFTVKQCCLCSARDWVRSSALATRTLSGLLEWDTGGCSSLLSPPPSELAIGVLLDEVSAFLKGESPPCDGCRGTNRFQGNLLLAGTGLGSAWQLRGAGSQQPESSVLLQFNEGIFLKTSTDSFMKKKKMSRE